MTTTSVTSQALPPAAGSAPTGSRSIVSRWRPVLRMARRDAWHQKRRSLLVIALIGLPVLILAAGDITYRTWQLSPSEKITRQIGAAQAGIQWQGQRLVQTPDAWLGGWTSIDTSSSAQTSTAPSVQPTTQQVASVMPSGSRVIEQVQSAVPLQFHTRAGVDQAPVTGLDYADPIARGLVDQLSGRAPQHAEEVAVTSALASADDLRVGQALTEVGSSTRLTIVGIVRDTSHRDDLTIYTLPSTLNALTTPDANDDAAATLPGGGPITWLVSASQPVTWSDVNRLNNQGYLVLSRQVYLHPPATLAIDPRAEAAAALGGGGISTQTLLMVALVVGMALIEVILLAGPAFAVGARRRRRELALVAAVGGGRRDLRNVVLCGGVVLGVTAGVVAVLAAIGLTAIGIPLLKGHVNSLPGNYDLRPVELVLLVLVSLVAAAAAAVFPAHLAGRTDVLAALAGRRGTTGTRARWPIAGGVAAVAGVLVALVGGSGSHSAVIILAGVALIEAGLIAATPALLGLVTRLSTGGPLVVRMAVRDAGRNRSAATPAVAAVMASVIGAVATLIALTSLEQRARHNYLPFIPVGTSLTVTPQTSPSPVPASQVEAVERAMERTLPISSAVLVQGLADNVTLVHPGHPEYSTGQNFTGGAELAYGIVDDGTHLATYYGQPGPVALAALKAGRAVVADPTAVHDGQVTFDYTPNPSTTTNPGVDTTNTGSGAAQATTSPPPVRVTVPATAITTSDPATPGIVLPPSLADRLHIPHGVGLGVLTRNSHNPSSAQIQAARAAIIAINPGFQFFTETGYHDPNAWLPLTAVLAAAFIAIAAAMIATALANVDARPDLTTLAAVGASPRTRRLLAMARAGLIATLGTVVGVIAGLVAPAAWVLAVHRQPVDTTLRVIGAGRLLPPQNTLHLDIPWATLIALLAGIPLVTTLIAGATSRSRLPSERQG